MHLPLMINYDHSIIMSDSIEHHCTQLTEIICTKLLIIDLEK